VIATKVGSDMGQGRKDLSAKWIAQAVEDSLAALQEVAAGKGATPAQVSLAWIMAQPAITAPIASATTVKQVEELLGALALTLDAGDLKTLDRASAN
jgi:aryl-alcohol dehydrogenase-like predicted oxidoreductase